MDELGSILYTSLYNNVIYKKKNTFVLLPPDSREGLGGDNIQGVPGRDAEAIIKAQHENHHGFTGAEPQEKTADAW